MYEVEKIDVKRVIPSQKGGRRCLSVDDDVFVQTRMCARVCAYIPVSYTHLICVSFSVVRIFLSFLLLITHTSAAYIVHYTNR